MRLGALEAGGTKMVLAIGDEFGNIFEQTKIPTTTPEETMAKVVEYFADKNIEALGVAAFGPVCLDKNHKNYGKILETTKTAWRYFDVIKSLESLNVPIEMDTDVNGSCIGEAWLGAGKGLKDVLYLTVGTGIGAGIMVGGKLVQGMLHAEAGHVLINKRSDDPLKESVCAYHPNCVEGLASGSAIMKRYNKPASELLDNDEVWDLEADYLAQALTDYIMIASPKRIILGGGVMHVEKLFPLIREKVRGYINNYLITDELKDLDSYIVPPALNDDQGIIGCLYLAKSIMEK